MIVGIGTDITRIERIDRCIERFGFSFANRILTDYERAQWQKQASSVAWLAKRFAAKEATAKAFGIGIGKLSFQHIEVRNNDAGAPELLLYHYGLRLQQQRDVLRLHISLSDENDYAIAFVVLEK